MENLRERMGKQILLMRHGESFSNVGKIFACRSVDYDLTEKGKTDAGLAIPSIQQFQPDRIYCSPSKRAFQTATIVSLALGVPVVSDAKLLEVDVGELEGKDEYAEPYRSRFEQTLAVWQSGDYSRAFPSGESFVDLDRRLTSFLNETIVPSGHTRIMIVSHSITLMAFLWKHCHGFRNKLTDNYMKTASTVLVTLSKSRAKAGRGRGDRPIAI